MNGLSWLRYHPPADAKGWRQMPSFAGITQLPSRWRSHKSCLAFSFRAPTLQGIPQALELINDFLLPVAIDFAVYTDLQRVVKRYGLLELGHATRWTERLLRDDSISCSGSVTLEAKAAQPKLCLMRQPVATWTSSNGCSRTTGMCAN